jgi:uncharacterized membrane protein HdeD (DUF308 family)
MNEEKSEEVKAEVVEPEEKAGVLAIVSLITGIVSLVFGCIPFAGIFFAFACGLAAIITGIMERKKIASGESSQKGKGIALAGLIMGICGIVFGVVAIIIIAVSGSLLGVFGAIGSGLTGY